VITITVAGDRSPVRPQWHFLEAADEAASGAGPVEE
jgi:hypothetical protein